MSYFRNIFSKLITKDKLILGRWNMNYSDKYLDHKIYLANHDHCGPCGSIQKEGSIQENGSIQKNGSIQGDGSIKKNISNSINERSKGL